MNKKLIISLVAIGVVLLCLCIGFFVYLSWSSTEGLRKTRIINNQNSDREEVFEVIQSSERLVWSGTFDISPDEKYIYYAKAPSQANHMYRYDIQADSDELVFDPGSVYIKKIFNLDNGTFMLSIYDYFEETHYYYELDSNFNIVNEYEYKKSGDDFDRVCKDFYDNPADYDYLMPDIYTGPFWQVVFDGEYSYECVFEKPLDRLEKNSNEDLVKELLENSMIDRDIYKIEFDSFASSDSISIYETESDYSADNPIFQYIRKQDWNSGMCTDQEYQFEYRGYNIYHDHNLCELRYDLPESGRMFDEFHFYSREDGVMYKFE